MYASLYMKLNIIYLKNKNAKNDVSISYTAWKSNVQNTLYYQYQYTLYSDLSVFCHAYE